MNWLKRPIKRVFLFEKKPECARDPVPHRTCCSNSVISVDPPTPPHNIAIHRIHDALRDVVGPTELVRATEAMPRRRLRRFPTSPTLLRIGVTRHSDSLCVAGGRHPQCASGVPMGARRSRCHHVSHGMRSSGGLRETGVPGTHAGAGTRFHSARGRHGRCALILSHRVLPVFRGTFFSLGPPPFPSQCSVQRLSMIVHDTTGTMQSLMRYLDSREPESATQDALVTIETQRRMLIEHTSSTLGISHRCGTVTDSDIAADCERACAAFAPHGCHRSVYADLAMRASPSQTRRAHAPNRGRDSS